MSIGPCDTTPAINHSTVCNRDSDVLQIARSRLNLPIRRKHRSRKRLKEDGYSFLKLVDNRGSDLLDRGGCGPEVNHRWEITDWRKERQREGCRKVQKSRRVDQRLFERLAGWWGGNQLRHWWAAVQQWRDVFTSSLPRGNSNTDGKETYCLVLHSSSLIPFPFKEETGLSFLVFSAHVSIFYFQPPSFVIDDSFCLCPVTTAYTFVLSYYFLVHLFSFMVLLVLFSL